MLSLTIPLSPEEKNQKACVAGLLHVREDEFSLVIRKRSLDARKKPVFIWSFDLTFRNEKTEKDILKRYARIYQLSAAKEEKGYEFPKAKYIPEKRPVIVGFGPSGIFCALMLARSGFRPIVLERGGPIEERVEAVDTFFRTGKLDTSCNIQFGEGGAGTFSDGKLNTLIKDKSFRGYYILEQMVKAGAPEEILWLNKPHIGTDYLRNVIRQIRNEICSLGGEVLFHKHVTDFFMADGQMNGVGTDDGEKYMTDTVVLALGHSARDTFRTLHEDGIVMEKKPFSVGVRIEHPQEMISFSQYGCTSESLPPADYKLVCHTSEGRTVYTFCMCPGGYVVAAASDEDGVVTNGMSNHARDAENANSALLCEVRPEDVPGGLFSGMEFQRELEKVAFRVGGGEHRAPAQTVGDFLEHRKTEQFGDVKPTYSRGVTPSDLHDVLPAFVTDALEEALPSFGRKIKGFDRLDAVMTGVESRSTSPVRICREENSYAASVRGLYPIGEGAGYAGGIISAAIDGLKCAEILVLRD